MMSDEIMNRVGQGGTASRRLTPLEGRRGFWRRQFQAEPTLPQLIFDVTGGMILPVLCLVFDPIFFRSGLGRPPLFGDFQFFVYAMIAIEIVALGVWLAAGRRTGDWCGILAGVMLAGAVFAAGIGLIMLPFTVIGLAFGIGLLGFTPFVTSLIYWRNARRAHRAASARMSRAALCLTLLPGAVVPFAAPAFAQWRVSRVIERSLSEVLGGNDARANAAERRLVNLSWVVPGEFDQMVWAYDVETNPARKERLALVYRNITGGDIESRLNLLKD
jgi:hypothetical protein